MNNVSVSKKVVVVGDKFNEFSNGRNVVTISQLELITQIPANIIETNTIFIAGQGVREDYAGKVLGNMHRNKHHDNKIDLTDLQKLTTTERNCHSHKKDKYNTLIGTAERVNEDLFALPLLIDERCELMGDHQTGKHVQGMILVEACRQTFIAITEEFYMSEKSGQSYYVINDMNMNFSNFLFPLPAFVHYELLERDVNERRSRFKAMIRISQHTTLCASMAVSFTVYPATVISEKETTMAASLTQSMLEAHHSASQVEGGTTHA